jgi:hypothetical protein
MTAFRRPIKVSPGLRLLYPDDVCQADLQADRSPSKVRPAVPWKSTSFLLLSGSMNQIPVTQKSDTLLDHRFIKRITLQMKGFKSFASAQSTLARIETAYMIRKGQLAGK